MEDDNPWFAKPLSKEVRFMAALRVLGSMSDVSKTHTDLDLIYSVIKPSDVAMNAKAKAVIYKGKSISDEAAAQIRAQFLALYNDEDGLVKWLNKQISHLYFRRGDRKKYLNETESAIKAVLNDILIDEIEI